MAEMVKTPAPLPSGVPAGPGVSAWAPLREPLFRSMWIAAIVSYIGTWMQAVGAGWMMAVLTMSPLMVGLVQAAVALPVFLVILPAGALADMVDRRQFLLLTQGWMVLAAGGLGVLTRLHLVTPWVLLAFTFLLGLGAVMNDPAWQAITPELVPPEQHAAAVALNSAGFNVARAIGPPLGGMGERLSAERLVVFWGDCGALWLEAARAGERGERGAVGRGAGGDSIRSAVFAGAVGAGADGSVQRWRDRAAGAAAADIAALRRDRVRRVAGELWRRSARGGHDLAPAEEAAVGRRAGGRGHRGVRADDVPGRTGGRVHGAVRGAGVGGSGVDRHSGLPEHGGADHVSFVGTGAGAVDVSAGFARRHGPGQYNVGRAGHAHRSA